MANTHYVLVIGEGFNPQNPAELSLFSLAAIVLAETYTRNEQATLLLHKEVAAHPTYGIPLHDRMQAELERRFMAYKLLQRESYNALTDARAAFDYLNSIPGKLELLLVCYVPEVLLHQRRLYRRVLKYEYPELNLRLKLGVVAATEVPRIRLHQALLYSVWGNLWRLCNNRLNYEVLSRVYDLATRGRVNGFVGTVTPAGHR